MPVSDAAFCDAYRAYGGRVYGWCYYRLHHVQDAQDAAAEVWAKAWRARSRFDGANWAAWLRAITRHSLTDRARRRGAKIEYLPLDENHPAADEEGAILDRDEVRRLLALLTPRQRATLVRHYLLDIRYKDEPDEAAARQRGQRALRTLRRRRASAGA